MDCMELKILEKKNGKKSLKSYGCNECYTKLYVHLEEHGVTTCEFFKNFIL